MRSHNTRLPAELAQHLATFGVKRNEDSTYSWKFDPYQRAMAPHRLSPEDHVSLWSRITCPTLLLHAEESFLKALRLQDWQTISNKRAPKRYLAQGTGFITTSLTRSLAPSGPFSG